jgi:hypothetical protein
MTILLFDEKKSMRSTLVELSSNTLQPETKYTTSFWFYNAGKQALQMDLK